MESRKKLYNASIRAGLIIAVIGIVVFILEYVLDIKPIGFFKPFLIMFIGIAINIVALVLMLKKYRAEAGGVISFLDAFLYCFIALVTAAVISTIFSMLFIQFFDPDYMKNIMQAQRDWMENYLTGKVSDEQMTAALEKIDEQAANMNAVSQSWKTLLGGVIVGGIVSLIIAAIMKKNPDVFSGADQGGSI